MKKQRQLKVHERKNSKWDESIPEILLKGKTKDRKLNACIYRLNRLETTITRPFFLEVLRMMAKGSPALPLQDAREIFLFLAPPEYLAGIGLLGIMQLRWLFTMGVYVIDPGTAKSGKTWWVSVMLGLAVLVNLGSNAILTPRMGLYGAVISELLGYVTAMCGRWIVSDRLFPIDWDHRCFILLIALYGAAAYGQTRIILSDMPWALSFPLRLLMAATVIGAGWLLIGKDAREIIGSIISNVKAKLPSQKHA